MTGERLEWWKLRRLLRFCGAAAALIVVVGVVYNALLVPILMSCFLTYLLEPLVELLVRSRLPRLAAVLLISAGLVAAFAVAAVELAPVLYHQALLLVQQVPGAVNTVLSTWLPLAERYVLDLGVAPRAEVHQILGAESIVANVAHQLETSLSSIWKTGTSVAGGLMNLVLIPILTFFMLKDYAEVARFFDSLVPQDLKGPVLRLVHRINLTLRAVLKGQTIVAGILMLLYVAGLSAVGLQSSIAIGVVAGICRLIPYADVVVGGVLSAIVLLSTGAGWGMVLSVVLVFLVVQAVDGLFITPSVVGERVGLHPMLIILSVLAFGDWLGFWGVLLAIPIAALGKVMLEAGVYYYRQSRAYLAADEGNEAREEPFDTAP